MKKKQMTLRTITNSNGTCSIWLENARLFPKIFYKISKIINEFTEGEELYFGHYKVDGLNISWSKFKQYGLEISAFFQTNGQYYPLVETYSKNEKVCIRQELIVCSAPNNEETYKMLEKIFHYYLDTIVFSPKVDWDTFVHSYKNYMNVVINDYVLNEYTDFIFSYTDSGDFSITFNPELNNSKVVQERINKIIFE